MAKNTLKKIKSEESKDGVILRDFVLSQPARDVMETRQRIARCLGVKDRTVVVWLSPSTFRKRFRSIEREALEREFGQKIF